MTEYDEFLARKAARPQATGLTDLPEIHPTLFPFQRECVQFALRQGRCGMFLSTGLGKSFIAIEYCRHAADATNGRALILTPLAVAQQMKREADKLGAEACVVRSASDVRDGINICNYDRLDKLDPDAFGVVVLDEGSIIKQFGGATTRAITRAFAGHRFRMSATATPAPNDHMEFGTQAEFLGVMAHREMLSRWFINDTSKASQHWRLKGHAKTDFWDWMSSWSRMAAMPSDLGHPDDGYVLPQMRVIRHRAAQSAHKGKEGELFAADVSATSMYELKRQTTEARADLLAAVVATEPSERWVIWCDTDAESAALAARIPDAVEVRGSHPIDIKEERLEAFASGRARAIISKPSICGWGTNWQFCARMAFVGRTFSYEQWFQAVRRCWRFGQTRPVDVHLIVAEGEDQIGRVIDRKAADHEDMRAAMTEAMRRNRALVSGRMIACHHQHQGRIPTWLTSAPSESGTSARSETATLPGLDGSSSKKQPSSPSPSKSEGMPTAPTCEGRLPTWLSPSPR